MKIAELLEYRIAPLGQMFSKAAVINLLADESNVELLRTHIPVPSMSKDLVVAKYSFDNSNLMFSAVERQDNTDVAGYLIVKKVKEFWQVQDAAVYKSYAGLGVGMDLYVKVIQDGYKLMSGFSLSHDAEKLWTKRLPKHTKVSVLDNTTGKTEPFSDKPSHSNELDNSAQQWFYVAETVQTTCGALLENYSISNGLGNLLYENWLLNRGYPTQSYRASRYSKDGDF